MEKTSSQKKLFSAELQKLKAQGLANSPAGSPDQEELVTAIAGLRADLQNVQQSLEGLQDAAPVSGQAGVQASADDEVFLLRAEIRALSLAIQQTKSEIAALRPPNSEEDRLIAVTSELDAIVTATERATHDILESAEKVQSLAERLQAEAASAADNEVVGQMQDVVIGLFEACNFQDITGQRITKVVKTLQFIEERVTRMIEIWGPENFVDVPRPPEVTADDDKRLLNGPALDNQGISQADIDKLFD